MTAKDPAARRRIGMLTPSSNTVLEPVTQTLLAQMPHVTAHFSRFKVTEIALDAPALAQFDDSEILRAAELHAHARVDVISWNGTSASWLGIDRDERLRERITAATGIRATSCILSLVEILRRIDARTQALVTPYTRDVQEKIIATYRSHGVDCPVERHLGIRDNFSFGLVPAGQIEAMVAECLAAGPDAVTILCTNMDGFRAAPGLEREGGAMVLDSVAVTLWGCLVALGERPDAITGMGRIFTDPRLQLQPAA